jgi:predicted nucleic acid-binding protein
VRVALDTNILAYAEGVNGASMRKAALDLVQGLPEGTTLLPVQTLGELFNLLVRKAKRPPAKARKAILSWRDAFPLVETSAEIMLAAADLATDHQLSIWDSVILSAAAESGCRLLLSEDLQEGFTWKGVTVTNPFAPSRHELLTALLDSESES